MVRAQHGRRGLYSEGAVPQPQLARAGVDHKAGAVHLLHVLRQAHQQIRRQRRRHGGRCTMYRYIMGKFALRFLDLAGLEHVRSALLAAEHTFCSAVFATARRQFAQTIELVAPVVF